MSPRRPARRPTAAPDLPVVRMRAPADVVVAVPYLIGFEPSDSLVVLALSKRDGIRLTMRCDLPPEDCDPTALQAYLRQFREAIARVCADIVLLLVYPDAFDDPAMHDYQLPRRWLVALAREAFAADGLATRDAICVVPTDRGHRIWSYLCSDESCCPSRGRVVDARSGTDVRFAFVSAGRAPRRTREELVASLAALPQDDPGAVALRAACERAATLRAQACRDGAARYWRRAAAADLDGEARTAAAVPPVGLGVDTQGRLAIALAEEPSVRDLLLGAAVRESRLEALIETLTPLVRQLPAPIVAGSAATLAATAYLAGEGALAWVGIDRARQADPDQSLARLIACCLEHGLPPYDFADLVRALPAPGQWDGGELGRPALPRRAGSALRSPKRGPLG